MCDARYCTAQHVRTIPFPSLDYDLVLVLPDSVGGMEWGICSDDAGPQICPSVMNECLLPLMEVPLRESVEPIWCVLFCEAPKFGQ